MIARSVASGVGPSKSSEVLSIAADLLVRCTDKLAACVVKAKTPDDVVA